MTAMQNVTEGALKKECMANNVGQEWKCIMSPHMAKYITTPFYMLCVLACHALPFTVTTARFSLFSFFSTLKADVPCNKTLAAIQSLTLGKWVPTCKSAVSASKILPRSSDAAVVLSRSSSTPTLRVRVLTECQMSTSTVTLPNKRPSRSTATTSLSISRRCLPCRRTARSSRVASAMDATSTISVGRAKMRGSTTVTGTTGGCGARRQSTRVDRTGVVR